MSEDGYLVNGSSNGNAHSEHSAASCDPAWEARALPAAQTVPKAAYMGRLGDVAALLQNAPIVASVFSPEG